MTYVIDIDGTICTNTDGKYKEAQPLVERIDKINQLYDEGHLIVFFTARGMKSLDGDVDSVYRIWYAFTQEQLKKWNVKYTRLIMGKPSADYYIDDKGLNADDFFKQ